MRETMLESELREEVTLLGGVCRKYTSPGRNGVPDRLIFMPGGKLFLAEMKAPGKKAEPLQLVEHTAMRRLGFPVFVIASYQELEEAICEIKRACGITNEPQYISFDKI